MLTQICFIYIYIFFLILILIFFKLNIISYSRKCKYKRILRNKDLQNIEFFKKRIDVKSN